MRLNWLVFSFIFLSIGCNASDNTWSEGACIDKSLTYEGATRDYYNRGAVLPWNNLGGDWIDDFYTSMGDRPFSRFSVAPTTSPFPVEADVSQLVNAWQTGALVNHGFFIRPQQQNAVLFESKESPESGAKPKLIIIDNAGKTHVLEAVADTHIQTSTYRCLGQKAQLSGKWPVLLKFDLSPIQGEVKSATLQLFATNKSNVRGAFNVFATEIKRQYSYPEIGFSQKLPLGLPIDKDPRVLFHEDFSDGFSLSLASRIRGSEDYIVENDRESFRPVDGQAMQIKVAKGDHWGSSHYIDLTEHKLQQAYMRYHIRLGKSWDVAHTGKLPGFTGTYRKTSMAAGWGGRKSNGKNGWSARGAFGVSTSAENTYPNVLPIGTYLYHADMKSAYGDSLYWNRNPKGHLQKERWYAIEQFIKMNTPGNKDGQIKAWVNGHLVFEKGDIRFTDDPRFVVENVWLNVYYGGKTPAPKDVTLFIDDLVVATEYIGSPLNR